MALVAVVRGKKGAAVAQDSMDNNKLHKIDMKKWKGTDDEGIDEEELDLGDYSKEDLMDVDNLDQKLCKMNLQHQSKAKGKSKLQDVPPLRVAAAAMDAEQPDGGDDVEDDGDNDDDADRRNQSGGAATSDAPAVPQMLRKKYNMRPWERDEQEAYRRLVLYGERRGERQALAKRHYVLNKYMAECDAEERQHLVGYQLCPGPNGLGCPRAAILKNVQTQSHNACSPCWRTQQRRAEAEERRRLLLEAEETTEYTQLQEERAQLLQQRVHLDVKMVQKRRSVRLGQQVQRDRARLAELAAEVNAASRL